jgi:hypothetical protein
MRVLGLLLPGALLFWSGAARAEGLHIYLAEDAQYRYVNATQATTINSVPADWFLPGFNDSSWFLGRARFGNSFGPDLPNAMGPQTPDSPPAPTNTTWDPFFRPYLRTTFDLPAPANLTLWLAVDNGVEGFYLNGVLGTASVNAEGTANRWEHVFDIPAAYTRAGTNHLAVQLEDHGGGTGYALVITADDTAVNPPFTTNPPTAVPEPASLALLALGAGGLAACTRRWRKRGG